MSLVGKSVSDIPEYSQPLKAQDGSDVTLSSFVGTADVCIFFYPKAATPGCTKEACSFRDEYSKFTEQGVKVFGISSDKTSANEKFATKQKLPYPLLSDEGGKLRKALGIKKHLLGLIPGRQTFVINKEGKIVLSYNDLSHKNHVSKALEVLGKGNTATPATAATPEPAAAETAAPVPEAVAAPTATAVPPAATAAPNTETPVQATAEVA